MRCTPWITPKYIMISPDKFMENEQGWDSKVAAENVYRTVWPT